MQDKITYRDLCDETQQEYQVLIETKMWPPAATAGDKGDAPQALVAQVLKQLVDKRPTSNTPNTDSIVCRYCKKTGHTKEDCLKLKKKNARGNGKPSPAPTTTSVPTNTTTTSNDTTWKTIAPTNGSPKTINREGKTWMWCAKCGSWRVSHGTSGHKTNEELASQRAQQANVASPSDGPSNGPLMSGW